MKKSKISKRFIPKRLAQLGKIIVGIGEEYDPILFLCRGALFISVFYPLILLGLFHFELPYLKDEWTSQITFVLLPGFLGAYLIARFSGKSSLPYAYALFALTLVIDWYLAVNSVTKFNHSTNYYRYLPLLATTSLTYFIAFIAAPRFMSALVLFQNIFVFCYPLFKDPSAQAQFPAFVIYLILVAAMFSLYVVIHTSMATIDYARTQEIQLNQAKRLSIVGRTASGIAHDYNNLLSIALNNLESIGTQKLTSSEQQMVAFSTKSLEHAALISQKLLSLGQGKSKKELISISTLFDELELFLISISGEHINLTVQNTSDATVYANQPELESAIVNLVFNAKNAQIGRGGEISVYTKQLDDKITIVVQDNGPGIPDEIQSRIFEPYFSTRNGSFSSGLGLSIVKNFMDKISGKVYFDSVPGLTRFYLELPQVNDEKQIEISSPQQPNSVGKSVSDVLVVDDNELVLNSICQLMLLRGVNAFGAHDFASAEAVFNDNPNLDLIFLDQNMLDGTGFDLGQILMSKSTRADFYILTGGNADENFTTECLNAGFKGVLLKPLNFTKFLETQNITLKVKKPAP